MIHILSLYIHISRYNFTNSFFFSIFLSLHIFIKVIYILRPSIHIFFWTKEKQILIREQLNYRTNYRRSVKNIDRNGNSTVVCMRLWNIVINLYIFCHMLIFELYEHSLNVWTCHTQVWKPQIIVFIIAFPQWSDPLFIISSRCLHTSLYLERF